LRRGLDDRRAGLAAEQQRCGVDFGSQPISSTRLPCSAIMWLRLASVKALADAALAVDRDDLRFLVQAAYRRIERILIATGINDCVKRLGRSCIVRVEDVIVICTVHSGRAGFRHDRRLLTKSTREPGHESAKNTMANDQVYRTFSANQRVVRGGSQGEQHSVL
jgi:hypothetical protein